MAKAKVNQWVGQLRDMGRVLRWNFPSIDKARWPRSWIQTAKKPLTAPSSKVNPSEANKVPEKCEVQGVGFNGIRDLQLGDPSIPKIENEMTARPQNGFISRALYYRRFFYLKR